MKQVMYCIVYERKPHFEMKKLYPIMHAKTIPVIVRAVLFIVLSLTIFIADAQTVVTNPASPWTVPAGVTSITVYLWGGGGGGGGGNNSGSAWGNGGGGGGGGCGYATIAVTAGTSCTLSIGTGGTAGTSGGGNGGNGSLTSFTIGGSTWSASGGSGGKGSSGANGATFPGGAGGSTFLGTGIAGNGGGIGSTGYDASSIVGTGGGGGGSGGVGTSPTIGSCGGTAAGGTGAYPGGNGSYNTKCGNKDQAGLAGVAPGGGGSGADSYNNNYAGGTGGAGQVTIVYTVSLVPTITSFTPTSGCSGSLPLVTITGTNFTGATAVSFNGTAAASYTVVSATSITATPASGTTSGTISVTTAGGTATSAGTFTVNTTPTATITPAGPSTFCGSGTLTASGGGNYLWNATGGSAIIAGITASASGTYVVTVTTPATGCSASASNVVTINPIPAAPTAVSATPASICAGGTSQLNATSAGNTINWWTAASGGVLLGNSASGVNYAVSPASTTTYYAEALTGAGCASASRVAVTVTVNPLPSAPTAVTATPAAICAGQTSQLNATSAGNTINWWTAATGGSLLGNSASGVNYAVSPASTTTYYAEALTAAGCASASRVSVTVTINPLPTAVTVSGGGTFCGSATLTATGGTGGTIYWENTTSGGTSTATSSASQTVSASGTYYFRANNACGWGTQGSAAVTINALPSVNAITGPTSVCVGSTITLSDATALGTWSSSNSSATVLLGVVTGVSAGTDTISYTVTNIVTGCTNTAIAIITVNPLPTAVITPAGPSSFCVSGTLTASGGGTYQWNATGGSATTAAITASANGTYAVTVSSAAGCTASASNTVTVHPLPAAAITPAGPSTFCGSGTLTASGGGTYQWNATGGSATIAAITASASGTYIVTVTSGFGCTASASNVVTVNPLPAAAITPAGPSTFCGSGTLTASGGGTYQWNATGGSATTAAITASASGTYTVTVTTPATGCSASASNVVMINPVPAAPTAVTAVPATICAGATSQLNGTSAGNTIRWWTAASGGALLGTSASGVNYAVTPASTTTYYAEAYTAAGCASASRVAVTVTVNPLPGSPTAVTATPASICVGATSQLNATSAGNTINWWTAATGGALLGNSASVANFAVTPASTTTYYAEALTAAGCVSASRVSVTVTVNALPTPSVNNATSCNGATVTLTATGGTSYHWSTGAITASITTATAGTYTVTATNAAGCTATASGTVTSSTPVITVNNPATCAGGTDTLIATGGGAGATYVWSTGSTSDTITTTIAGVYNVTVTNSLGCSATASGIATVNALPIPVVANDTICSGAIATLTVSGGVIYKWSTGATTTSITTATAGTYTVTATSIGGCTASTTGLVVIVSDPTVTATNGVICSGTATTVTASGASSYVWSTGATTTSISVSSAGTYTVTGTSSLGCTASANSTVTSSTNPTPTVTNTTICAGNNGTITVTAAGSTFVWSTGAITASITVSPASTTTYTVTATNASGCSATASGTVTVNAIPTPTVNNGVLCSGASTILTATGGTSYHWSTLATTASITVSSIGTYTVTATNAATCTASVTSTVTAAVAPVATVNSVSVCSGTSSTLTATITAGGPCTYLWSTGATTAGISVAPPSGTTTYRVTVTNASGCTASASGTYTAYPVPTVTPSSNSPILINGTINLSLIASGGAGGNTYSWSGPSSFTSTLTSPSITSAQPSNAGIYTVTVSDLNSCSSSGSTVVVLNFTSPGGIPSNDALWLAANYSAVTTGSNVTAWDDLSGLSNNASTVNGTSPTLVNNSINSYPVVNFAGSGGLQGAFGTAVTSTAVSAFVVTQVSTTSGSASGIFSIVASGGTDSSTANTNSAVLFERGNGEIFTERNKNIQGNYTNANAIGQYHLETSIFANSGVVDNYFYSEGTAANSVAYAATAFNDGVYTIGSRYIGGVGTKNYLTGQIAEVILYNKQLTAAQKNQVESYLALKYGFTLNQSTATNYVATSGAIFWNAASNTTTYNHNIFGVGWDNIDSLKQTQSVSINTSQLSINSATGLTYYSFLMASDNGVPDTLDAKSGLPNSINAALTTVWRASQTGSRITANYVLNTSTVNFNYYAPISASMTPYMLIDSNHDGIYETYIAASSTVGSNITFSANLNDGALFTFGFKASIDYGDAWGVPTLTANNGAGHMIVPGVYLGSLIDAELDGQPSVNALGDDTIGLADEDGVNFNIGVPTTDNIVTMGTNTIVVTASVAGYLNAWADLNQNNSYEMDDEYLIINKHLVAGANTITFTVSDSILYGPTSMRFRFDTILGDVTAPTGLAKNGEVEDYKIYVTAPLVTACNNGFQNPSFEQGPDIGAGTYIITSESNMPYWRTTATDGMIEQWGNGFNGGGVNVPAYNGTYFMELEANLYGALYQDVYTSPGTKLSWSFAHRGRFGADTCLLKIGTPENPITQGQFIDGEFAWGVHTGFYTVPAGQYITRVAFDAVGSFGGNQSEGNFLDDVSVQSSFDFGDAPDTYSTLFASGGPYHNIIDSLYLGLGVTCDADGKPSVAANLDSLDDGVTFPTPCASCSTYTVNLTAMNATGSPATIAGWIDFNKNGVFDAAERASVTIPSSTSEQSFTMTFNVTTFSAISSGTYARFRIANDSTQIALPTGFAATGEVEDYAVPCIALPLPVPSVSPSPSCARGPVTLIATDSATFTIWSGPNGFVSYSKDTTMLTLPASDSGSYRVYAIYANGCERDSAVNLKIQNCYVNITGNIFDDANGNGKIDGTDATTDLSKTIYAVLSDNTNTVLQTNLITATGAFSFTNAPAYTSGMTILTRTSNPAVGGSSGGSLWPNNWVGTKEQYGTNNLAGSGVDATPNLLIVQTGISNVTGALLGFDQLPTTTVQTYIIPYPGLNSQKSLIPAHSLGILAGSDPEDGTFTSGSTFTITSLAGMNGNTLYYDANGDGILQSYEQIMGYTTITNFDPTKLFVKFTGAGSTQAVFNYGSTDAAGKVDPAPATYTIKWLGALPVTMLYFNAEKLGETQSLLNWATASEINNDHFDVERSSDAETWAKIGQVKGAGTTEVQTDYSFTDQEPLSGINYYRLKQVDVDGNFEYTNITDVTFDGSTGGSDKSASTLSVYPNPLNQSSQLNIALTSTTDNINEVSIVNEVGQVVYSTLLPQIQNYQVVGLNLPSGVYIVTVHTQSNTQLTSRLVIAR